MREAQPPLGADGGEAPGVPAGLQLGDLSVPARWSESDVSPSRFSFPQSSAFGCAVFVVRKTKAISTIWEKKAFVELFCFLTSAGTPGSRREDVSGASDLCGEVAAARQRGGGGAGRGATDPLSPAQVSAGT